MKMRRKKVLIVLDFTTADFSEVTNTTLVITSLVSIALGVVIALVFGFKSKKSRGFLMTVSAATLAQVLR